MKKYKIKKKIWFANMGNVHLSLFVKGKKKTDCEVNERWKFQGRDLLSSVPWGPPALSDQRAAIQAVILQAWLTFHCSPGGLKGH